MSPETREATHGEKTACRLILEIGPGWSPFPEDIERRKLTEGEVYIGIEPDLWHVKEASKLVGDNGKLGKGKSFIVNGVGECLPFRNSNIDEVVIANVFSSAPNILGSAPRGLENSIDIKGIMKEVARVLKEGGKLYTAETYTPDYIAPRTVIDLAQEEGLKCEKTVRKDDGLDKIKRFALPASKSSYLLEFTKPYRGVGAIGVGIKTLVELLSE